MADVYEHKGSGGWLDLAGLVDGNYVLSEGSPSIVATLVLHVVVTSGTISIIPKARSLQKNARRDADNVAFQPVPYVRRNVGGTVSDDTAVSTAIAATGIFKVDITGLQPSLEIDVTGAVVGAIYWTVVEGAAA
jgi:hypothetical protein